MKKQIILLALFLISQFTAFSQDPFEKYGYKPRIHTLSDGKYQEFFDNEDVVRIGTAMYNTQTQKIVGYVEDDSTKYQKLESELASRWMSLDPMAEEFPRWSPYTYAADDPINKFDPNGMYFESLIDVGFILYDVGEMAYDYATTGKVNSVSVAALSADVACLALPIATGGGLAVRAAKEGGEQIAKHVATDAVEKGAKTINREATERGIKNEAKTLKNEGLTKNNEIFKTTDAKTGKTVSVKPDANDVHQVSEVKDTKRVSNTEQIRGERQVAKEQNKSFKIYTGEKTKVSKNIPKEEVERRSWLGPQNQ